jgi:phosphoenolpyruvate-protein phosphotransferase
VGVDGPAAAAYGQRQEQQDIARSKALEAADQPAVTLDGSRVEVVANIGSIQGAAAAIRAGADGIGLLRTEFLYLERDHLPGEEEQYRVYRAIADLFGELSVILRTLDVGGDKELPYLDLPDETNPFLGVRAVRLSLARPELLKPQLRAALRAGVGRNLKIMFPMVSTLGEVAAMRQMLHDCRTELENEGQVAAPDTQIGIMVEVPAAVVMADRLAAMVDFFSIGTNDLAQYTMAADRTNADLAHLTTGFQPAVLRMVGDTIRAAHDQGKPVGLCGELAGEPLAIPILLGLGLDEFSMNPPAIPTAKQIIRQLSMEEAQDVAREALQRDSPDAVKALVEERVPSACAI